MNGISERDWKYLRSVKAELLESLCARINDEALRIVAGHSLSQHEKFLGLYALVMERNAVVADCFNDWRRSNILLKLLMLRRHQLLTDEVVSRLSEETQGRLGAG